MRIPFLALIMLIGLSACASSPPDATSDSSGAATADSASASGDAVETAPKTKLVCHRERGTGSRLSAQRLCKEVPIE